MVAVIQKEKHKFVLAVTVSIEETETSFALLMTIYQSLGFKNVTCNLETIHHHIERFKKLSFLSRSIKETSVEINVCVF